MSGGPKDLSPSQDNIKVAIRSRPLIQRETESNQKIHWNITQKQVTQIDGGHKPFYFDRVFGEGDNTDDVYTEIAAPVIESAMQGFHGTIFAYGQTASGKTFTMMGNDSNPGVIPQAVNQIFDYVETSPDREFLIRVSYLEIYNENVVDLLGDVKKHLDVRENTGGSVFVSGLKEEVVNNPLAILQHMKLGEANRRYGSTNMNERSSRSHTIFRMVVESKKHVPDGQKESDHDAVNVSHLNLVDLAGSEKARHTGATGQRLTEGGFINKSLLTLGQVISQLSEVSSFVNYRDSKLTRILQNALGGNSKTAIICNVTLASQDETLSTLRFANSAKKINNKAVVNEVLSDEAMLKRYKQKINELQKALTKMNTTELHKENQDLEQKLLEKEKIRLEQEEKINKLKELFCVSSQQITSGPQTFNEKRKRRETWCPGKGRSSIFPGFVKSNMLAALPAPIMRPPAFIPEKIDARRKSDYGVSPMRHSGKSRSLSPNLPEDGSPVLSNDSSRKPMSLADELAGMNFSEPSMDESSLAPLQDISAFPLPSTAHHDATCQTEGLQANMDTVNEDLHAEEIEILQDQLTTQEKTLCDLETALSSKNAELTSLASIVDNSMELQMQKEDELQGQVIELKQRIAELESSRGTPEPIPASSDNEERIKELGELTEKVEKLETEKKDLQDDLQGAVSMTEQLLVNLHTETTEKNDVEDQLNRLELRYLTLEEEFTKKEADLQELEEFTQFERDFKNESILAKKIRLSSGGDDDLSHSLLMRNAAESEVLTMQSRKSLAQAEDEKSILVEQLDELRAELELIKKPNGDSSENSTESELKDQLNVALNEIQTLKCQPKDGVDQSADETNELVSELNDKVKSLEKEVQSLVADKELLEAAMDMKSPQISTETNSNEELETLRTQLKELENDYEAQAGKLAAAEELLQNEPTVHAPLFSLEETEKIDLKATDTAKLQLQLSEVQAEVTSLQQQLADQQELSESVTMQLMEAQERVEELEAQTTEEEAQSNLKSIEEFKEKVKLLNTANEDLQGKVQELESDLTIKKDQLKEQEAHFQHLLSSAEQDMSEQADELTKQLLELESEKTQLLEKVSELEAEINNKVCPTLIENRDNKTERYILEQELQKEKLAHEALRQKFDLVNADSLQTKDRLLSEENKELDQQKRFDEIEKVRKEALATFAATQKANSAQIEKLNKLVYDGNCQTQKHRSENELAQHKLKKANEEIQKLKEEIRSIEDLHARHDFNQRNQHLDPERMMDQIKKMKVSIDLTQQRLTKFESENKELKTAAKRNEDASFERNNLQCQLRDLQHTLDQKQTELVQFQQRNMAHSTELAQLRLERSTLQDKLDRAVSEKERLKSLMAHSEGDMKGVTKAKEEMQMQLKNLDCEKANMSTQIEKLNEKIASLKEQLSVAIGPEILDAANEKHEAELKSKITSAVDTEKAYWQEIMEKKESEQHSKIKELEMLLSVAPTEEAIEGMMDRYREETTATVADVRKEEQEHWQIVLDNREKDFKEKIEELQVQLNGAPSEDTLEALTEKHTEELRLKLKEVKESAKEYWEAIITKKEAKAREEFEEKLQGEIMTLRDATLNKLAEEQEALQAKHNSYVEGLVAQHEARLQRLREEHQQTIENLDLEHLEVLDALRLAHHDELDKVKSNVSENENSKTTMLQEELQRAQEELGDAESILVQKEVEIETLEEEKQTSVNMLKQEILEIEQQQKRQINKLEAAHREMIATLQADHKEVIRQADSKYEELLSSQMSDTDSKVEEIIAKYKEEIVKLEIDIEHLRQDSQLKEDMLSEYQTNVKEWEEQFNALNKENDNLSDALKAAQCEHKTLVEDKSEQESVHGDRVKELEVQIKSSQEKYDEISEKLFCLEIALQETKDKLTISEEELVATSARLTALEETKENEEGEQYAELTAEIENLQEIIEKGRCMVMDLENKVKNLEDQLEIEKELTDQCAAERDKTDEQLRELEEQLAEASGDPEKETELQKNIDLLKEQIHQVQVQAEEKLNSERERVAELDSTIKKIMRQSNVGVEENDLLKSRLKDLEQELTASKEKSTKIQNEMEQKTKEFEKRENFLIECCDSAEDDLAQTKRRNEEMEMQAKSFKTNSDKQKQEKLEAEIKQLTDSKRVLEKSLQSLRDSAEKEEEFLKKCCDEADEELEQEKLKVAELNKKMKSLLDKTPGDDIRRLREANHGLSADVDYLKKQYSRAETEMKKKDHALNNLRQSTDAKEYKKLQKDLATANCKIVALQTELLKVTDPLEKKLKFYESEEERQREINQKLKNEIRRLKNTQPDDSVLVAPTASRPDPKPASGSGIVNNMAVFTLECENAGLKRENSTLKEKTAESDKKDRSRGLIEAELRRQVEEREWKIKDLEKQCKALMRYYKKELSEPERSALKDLMNTSAESLRTIRKHSTKGTSTSGLDPDAACSGAAASDKNFIAGAMDLFKDEPSDCNQQ